MISFVVAYSQNQVIGQGNQLPWYLPNDLKHFQKITLGKTIVMGRKTFLSIGRPLPKRTNVVLTKQLDFSAPGIEVAHTKSDILARPEDVYIIGGAQIFSLFLDVVDRMYITEIETEIAGDTFFPIWDHSVFQLIDKKAGVLDDQNTLPHTFYTFERKPR